MSVKLSAYVWDGCAASGMKTMKIAIMARLADFSNDDGVSWPSVDTIARQVGAGRSTVITAINQLAKEGWLTKQERRKGQRSDTNIYRLNVGKLRTAANAIYSHGSESERPEFEHPKTEHSGSERSENHEKPPSQGPESGHDPSVTTDPSDKRSSCPVAEQPDELSDEKDFLTSHPEAAVFSVKKRQWGSQEDLTCAKWIWGRIVKLYEQAAEFDGELVKPKEPNWIAWSNEIRLMCSQDGRTHRQICELFDRANRDSFWCKNVLSPTKLREKWDDLSLKLSVITSSNRDGEVVGGHWNSPEGWETVL